MPTRAKFLGNDEYRLMSWKGFEPIDECYRKMWDIPRPMLHQMVVTPPKAWDAILNEDPYPVKAMICWSSNPLAWAPNTKHVYKALKALDLLVVVDYWKTPTAALADYILPQPTRSNVPWPPPASDNLDILLCGDRVVEPEYERHVDYNFFRDLGMRLGQEEYWPWETYEDVIAYRLERTGTTYEQAMERGVWAKGRPEFYKHGKTLANGQIKGFATPSKETQDIPERAGAGLRLRPRAHVPRAARDAALQSRAGQGIPDPPQRRRPIQPDVPFGIPRARLRYPLHVARPHRPDPRHRCARPGHPRRGLGVDRNAARAHPPTSQAGMGHHARGGHRTDESWFPELPAEEPWLARACSSPTATCSPTTPTETLDPMGGQWVNRGLLCKNTPASTRGTAPTQNRLLTATSTKTRANTSTGNTRTFPMRASA